MGQDTAMEMERGAELERPWSRSVDEVLDAFGTRLDAGLSEDEAEARLERHGPNELREAEKRSILSILWDQIASVVILLLIVAGIVSGVMGEWLEAAAIGAVVILNTVIGFVTEWRAVRTLESLQEFSKVAARVRRDGEERELPAEALVPGDVVLLTEGDMVPADLRVCRSERLQVDESPLTGESTPIEKTSEPVADDASLAERASCAYKGTTVSRGDGEGVVVATGMSTEVGEISEMVHEAEGAQTPLEERLDALGHRLVWLTLIVAFIVAAAGGIAGRDWALMFQTAIALAVAAVPEGLAIVATVALASGMRRMARRDALIRRLSSVETLGSTQVIFTDKTGTLTTGEMTLRRLWVDGRSIETDEDVDIEGDERVQRLLRAAVLANTADLDEETGDPSELALLRFGRDNGCARDRLLDSFAERRVEPFSRDTGMMATVHERDGEVVAAIKGAPEAVLDACTTRDGGELDEDTKRELHEAYTQLARDGLRVLAVAMRTLGTEEDDPYAGAEFLGFVGLLDPPRHDVPAAIEAARSAGISVKMITGDHPETARHIARETGIIVDGDEGAQVLTGRDLEKLSGDELLGAVAFARVSPRQKLDLISAQQDAGHVVAMTGDGVNDAPALKSADIGIAMGKRGTDVAKEAAHMVLLDDSFASITAAIRQGRNIFENIRRFVVYLLSGNVGEILAVAIASVIGAPLPLLPLQILYLNMINDVFPALALGVGEGGDEVMDHPPRDAQESIIARRHWGEIIGYGIIIGATILGAFAYALEVAGFSVERSVTVAFLTLSVGRLLHAFNMRDPRSGVLDNHVVANRWMWGAIVLSVGLLCVAVYVPVLSDVLRLTDPGLDGWLIVAVGSLVPLIAGQLYLAVQRWRGGGEEEARKVNEAFPGRAGSAAA